MQKWNKSVIDWLLKSFRFHIIEHIFHFKPKIQKKKNWRKFKCVRILCVNVNNSDGYLQTFEYSPYGKCCIFFTWPTLSIYNLSPISSHCAIFVFYLFWTQHTLCVHKLIFWLANECHPYFFVSLSRKKSEIIIGRPLKSLFVSYSIKIWNKNKLRVYIEHSTTRPFFIFSSVYSVLNKKKQREKENK